MWWERLVEWVAGLLDTLTWQPADNSLSGLHAGPAFNVRAGGVCLTQRQLVSPDPREDLMPQVK